MTEARTVVVGAGTSLFTRRPLCLRKKFLYDLICLLTQLARFLRIISYEENASTGVLLSVR